MTRRIRRMSFALTNPQVFYDGGLMRLVSALDSIALSLTWIIWKSHIYADLTPLGYSVLELEDEVNNSPFGKRMPWSEIKAIILRINDTEDFVVAGFDQLNEEMNFSSIKHLIKSAKLVISIEDSSYFTVYGLDRSAKQMLSDNYALFGLGRM